VASANVDERVIRAGSTWHRACYNKAHPEKAPAPVCIPITNNFERSYLRMSVNVVFRGWALIRNLAQVVDKHWLPAKIQEIKPLLAGKNGTKPAMKSLFLPRVQNRYGGD
jgi:hypothetical protein